MKILLVNTNYDAISLVGDKPFGVPPIGLAYISYPLKQMGYDIDFFDVSTSSNPNKDFDLKLNDYHPDIVGFSIRHVDNRLMFNPHTYLPEIKKLVGIVAKKKIISVLGGSGYSVFPEKILKKMNADYGISGQGEKSFPKLIKVVSEGTENFEHIQGLYYRKNGKIISNIPDHSGYKNVKLDYDLFNFHDYKSELWTGAVVTKTGCPHKCIYCDAPQSSNKFIPRDPEEIIEEIKFLKKYKNIKSFYFIDNCINSPLSYAKELLYKIVKADIDINLFSQLPPRNNCFDEELFELYSRAGGTSTVMGPDSFSAVMLANYNNGFTQENILSCSKLAEKYNIDVTFYLLVGGPGESIETLKESVDFIKRVKYKTMALTYGIRIQPGTPIQKLAIKERVITEDTDLLPPTFYFSKLISPEDAKEYVEKNVSNTGVFAKHADFLNKPAIDEIF